MFFITCNSVQFETKELSSTFFVKSGVTGQKIKKTEISGETVNCVHFILAEFDDVTTDQWSCLISVIQFNLSGLLCDVFEFTINHLQYLYR